MKSLAKTNDDYDPECVRCHVTGWATQGAFADYDSTPAHKNVNCEACHGPGAPHSNNPEVKTLAGKVDQNTCLRCHDPDNSPQFKFESTGPGSSTSKARASPHPTRAPSAVQVKRGAQGFALPERRLSFLRSRAKP